jgi:hypothetical protein
MQIVKIGRFALGLLLNLLAVWIGVAILSSALGRNLWHPRSIQALLRVSYSYDIFVSLILGFIVYRCFRSETAKWIWVVFSGLFLLRVAPLLASPSSLWVEMSGMACVNGMRDTGCMNWFLFTMHFVRGTAYSAGAWFCSRAQPAAPSALEDAFVGKFRRPEWESKINS